MIKTLCVHVKGVFQLTTVQSYPLLTYLKQAEGTVGYINYITIYHERTALTNAKVQKNRQNM
jgi:hypothetical protein